MLETWFRTVLGLSGSTDAPAKSTAPAPAAAADRMIVPALPGDVLASPNRDLWSQVLRRQGIPMALLATHPGDLQRN